MGPDFVMIGAMKCGTSTVSAWLEEHPEVFMVGTCDPNFFGDDTVWARGQASYERLFAPGAAAKLRGENSNAYTNLARFPEAPRRMATLYPDLRLIYLVRDPVARIKADWYERRTHSGDAYPASLDAAVVERPDVFVDPSLYWRQLTGYRAHFPDAQIWIGFLEDMVADQPAFLRSLAAFLGISSDAALPPAHRNPSAAKRVPTPFYSQVRRSPVARLARRTIPLGLRRAATRRFLARPPAALPGFSPETSLALRAWLGDDARAFLAHAGKPPDFWPL